MNRTSQRWLDAHTDSSSCLYTFTRCMALADLQADGDYKLILADLGTGTSVIKLKVFKGPSLMSEITLTEIPTAVVTFYHDHQELKIPAIALASGSGLYIYKNMKPYYRFSLPDLEVSPLEMDLWIQARSEDISPSVLYNMLDNIKNEIGFSSMSYQSQKLLMISSKNEEELKEAVQIYSSQPIKRSNVITCMSTLFKNSSSAYSVSCLVVGTESGWIHIIDGEAFTVLDSVNQASKTKSTDLTVPVVIKTTGLFDVDFRILTYNRNGKLTLLRRNWNEPKIILQLDIPAVDMCVFPDSGNIFLALIDCTVQCYTKKGKKLWSIQLSANATSLLLIPLLHQSTTLMAVALEGGTICFYNGREMVDTIMAADTIAGMIFGRFGQEEHCLVLLTVGGVLQIKVLKRTAHFSNQSSVDLPISAAQNAKLKIPKKTSIFLEQAGYEMNHTIQMHRIFQSEVLRFRLETARMFYDSLNKVNNLISNDNQLPLKLSTEVFGLGPTFKIVLTLENMSQTSDNIQYLLNKTLTIVLHHDEKLYSIEKPFFHLPLLVPGRFYKFETLVRMKAEVPVSDQIHALVISSDDGKPVVSAEIHMPFCDVLPVEI